jgi:hypothetical protein
LGSAKRSASILFLARSSLSTGSAASTDLVGGGFSVPRGCLAETLALLEAHKIRPEVQDERYAGKAIEAEFQGQLRPFQGEAVAKITAHDEGILCADRQT